MLKTLNEAKEYALLKVAELTGETVDETEKAIIETEIEESFFYRIEEFVNEEELEKAKLTSPEDLDGYLFHKVPKYATILEEVTTDFLAEYLSE
ncbi:MAG: hypothetical protein WCG98_07170 [bacterium]